MSATTKASEQVTVEFVELGARKKTFRATLAEFCDAELYRAVMRSGALGSRGVDFTYDDDTKVGHVYVGGFRNVGIFRVIDGTLSTKGKQ